MSVAKEIKAGAEKVCHDAGILFAGGHSVDSLELCLIITLPASSQQKMLNEIQQQEKVIILLLKNPIGAGVITAALKRGVISEGHLEQAMKYMTTVNAIGEELG